MAQNPFDQFDSAPGANPFDAFDEQPAAPAARPARTVLGTAGDVGVTALKGAVGLPQAFMGLASLVSGGQAGKDFEDAGLRFSDAQKILDGMYSPAQQAANREVQQADGFVGTLKAAVDNPSVIATTVGESLPQMLGGAAIARGGLALTSKVAPWAAGAIGEGIKGAGSAAEQIRSESPDGLITGKQAAASLASGAGTAVIGGAAGRFAGSAVGQRLGLSDVDTMLAAGKFNKTPAGFIKQVVGSGISEGVFEELPQSIQEQMWQNYAQDKPLDEGVGKAGALGLLAGAAMGGAGGGFNAAQASLTKEPAAPAPAPAAPAADRGLAVDVTYKTPDGKTVTSTGTSAAPVAATNDTTAAEQALRTPVTLTALDRANEIDSKVSNIRERLADISPENGYGPAFDQERESLAQEAATLEQERASIASTWPAAVKGAPTSFATESGARLEGEYALMDAADLVTSHTESLRANPLYPQELQPRDRSRNASELQVSGIVQKLDPARLGVSADAATGAPIVGADGLVESGNARTIAMKRVYQANGQKAEDYKTWLRSNAEQFGLTPAAVDGMPQPVLVRVRSTPVNRAEFARQANASTVQRMSPSEQALSDAKRLASLDGLNPDEEGNFTNSHDFIRQFMATLPITEQSDLIESDGRLSTAGYRRVQNAVLARAYGDSPSLRRMTESLDNNLVNVSKALLRVAPTIAAARERMQAGTMYEADIAPDLLAAVEGLSALKEKGWTVAQELAQTDLTGPRYTPEAADLLAFLSDNIRSPRRIAEFFQRYYEALEQAGDPSQPSMFGDDGPAPARTDLLKQAQGATDGGTQNNAPVAGQDAERGVNRESAQAGQPAAGQPQDAPGRGRSDQGNGAARPDAGRGQQVKPAGEAAGSAPGLTADDLAGEKINRSWTAFAEDSGSLGIPRGDMPQIRAEHRGALVNFLKARGIESAQEEVASDRLKPTQAEFSPAKVEKAKSVTQRDRAILVSADSHVLDGHHQWLAKLEKGEQVKVIRLGAPIDILLEVVAEFPSVQQSDGAGAGSLPTAANSLERAKQDRNATSEAGAPIRGPLASMPGNAIREAPSSAALNQLPSGNLTNSSPEKPKTNSQPAGKVSGTLIGTPSQSILGPATPDTDTAAIARLSFAGARAVSADAMALQTAQDRLDAGDDAELVRRETGWHRGVDGRMRFEISDNEARVDMPLLANLHRGGFDERAIEHVSYRKDPDGTYRLTLAPKSPRAVSDFVSVGGIPEKLLPSLLPHSALDAIQKNQGEEDFIGANLDDARRVRAPFEFTGFNALPLDVVMDHPKLFAAYPALREIMVRVDRGLGSGARFAVTDYVDGTVGKAITIGNPLAKDVDSVLLHEIQHGIQDIEGFASGGSVESAREMLAQEQSQEFERAQRAWSESRARWPGAYDAIMAVRMLDSQLHDKYGIKAIDQDGNNRKSIVLAAELREKISERDKIRRRKAQSAYADAVDSELGGFGSDLFNEFNGLYSATVKALEGSPQTAMGVYKRLAGEVEARNTQARRKLPDVARKYSPPSSTADVAESDVIVVFNGKEMRNAPSPANAAAPVSPSGMPVADLAAIATRVRTSMPNMPTVHTLASPNDAPPALQDYIRKQGAWADVEGAMHEGELYLFASGLKDAERAEFVLAEHEAAHFGLRAVLGPRLPQAMRAIFNRNPAIQRAVADLQRRGSLSDIEATEEVLVDMPSACLVKLKGWRALADGLASWLSQNGFTVLGERLKSGVDASLTEQQRADLMAADVVRAARDYVRGKVKGNPRQAKGLTRLYDHIAKEMAQQETWLRREARARGYSSVDDLLERNYGLFERLAALWKIKNSDSMPVMSRAREEPNAEPRLSRRSVEQGRNLALDEDGRPVISGDGVVLQFAAPTERLEFIPTDGRQEMLQYVIGDNAGSPLAGFVDVLHVDGKPVELFDIEIYEQHRGSGLAARAIKALLDATPDGTLAISNIVPAAQGFWEKLGIGVQNLEEGAAYDGVITQSSFAASDAGRASARTQLREAALPTTDTRGARGPGEWPNSQADGGDQRGSGGEGPARVSTPRLSRGQPGLTPTQLPSNRWQQLKSKVDRLISAENVDKFLYEFQDKLIDLKRLREHIKTLGGTINDLNDAYQGEELYHKRVAKRTEDFLANELKPLLGDMNSRGITLQQFEQYLHARHAPEANKELSFRNPNQQMIDAGKAGADAQIKQLELALQRAQAAGTAVAPIEKALEDAMRERDRWSGAQAFKGTEAERLSLSGMSDQDAAAIMAALSPRRAADMKALAGKVDAINAKTLDALQSYGLMDPQTLQAWRSTYQHYVPLHRDEAHPDSVSHPIGQGYSVKGDAGKRRAGSNAKVTHILGHVAMQREAALTRGEKNLVGQKLYVMAAQNPDADWWQVDRPPKTRRVDAETGLVTEGVDPLYKNRPNVIMVRIAGKDAAIVFNERNERAARLAESLRNLDSGDLHYVLGWASKATRWFASVNTQYNPVFGIINFARDVQGALLNLGTTPLKGKEAEVAKHMLPALRAIYQDLRAVRAGGTSGQAGGQWGALWEQMQNDGGTTGYRDLYADPKDRAESLEKAMTALERGKTSQFLHGVLDWLSDYNETMEGATRLAAYKLALDVGMSQPQAASLAKNLTVNFNRKGRQAREIGALYAFFNAAVQGTTRMVETLRGPTGKKIMLGGVMLGAVNAMIGMAMMGGGGGDDENGWAKIPEFVRERSLVIPLGREDFVAIPLPLGFNVLPNMGRKAVEAMFGLSKKSAGAQLGEMLGMAINAFNPFGAPSELSGAQLALMLSPTVTDPGISLLANKDWTGKPIYRENTNTADPVPGHLRTKDTASTPSKAASLWLNKMSGGTDYRPGAISWTPDQIDYVIGQLTGGVGRELMKVNQMAAAPFTGDELPAHKIPLLGRLYGNVRGPSAESGDYHENVRELNELENELKGRARDGGDVEGLRAKEPLVGLIGRGAAAERQVQQLRKQRNAAMKAEDAARVKEINEQIGAVMKELNGEVAKARKAQ